MAGESPGSHGYEESERRRFFYADLERLVRVGFLRAAVAWGKHSLVFRSLSDEEFSLLVQRGGDKPNAIWMQWSVAHHLYMVDGFVCGDDPNTPFFVKKNFVDLIPSPFLTVLFSVVAGLQRRQTRASQSLEAFCYEPFSRILYRTHGYTTSRTNTSLMSWVAFHKGEDSREEDRSAWVRTQTIVGATSGKAAKQVRRSLEQEEQKEDARRIRVIEDRINFLLNGERKATTVTVEVNGKQVEMPVMRGAQTVAELEEEMRKAMEGELDGHDLQVQEYENAIRTAVEERAKRAERRRARQAQMGDLMRQAGIGGKTELVGYDVSQVPHLPRNRGAGVKTEATASSSRRLFDRYLKSEVGVGVIGKSGTPEPKDGKPLGERLEGRKVSLSSGPIPPDRRRGSE
jgi:hypothetical protein